MAYKDTNKNINKNINKNDGQEKENEENTKMFRHITAITCVIKPLVDCFLNNPSLATTVLKKPEWITHFFSLL